MKNHRLYRVWDQVPSDYYQKGIETNMFQRIWHRNKINLAKRLIKNLNFKKCLDVGCASGFMISQISETYPDKQYFGVDTYDKAINYAKKHYPQIKFKIASAEKMSFPTNSFDLIISYETIEHVENPNLALKEIRRVLKKNGTVLLAMDSGNWLFRIVWFIWENTKGRVWKESHIHPFHHNELEHLIKQTGFKLKQKIFSHLGMEVVFVLTK